MPDLRAFLDGGGHMAGLIRRHDWASTPLGPINEWPQSLRSALSICLRSKGAAAILWGCDCRFIYNDAWAGYIGDRHPRPLGKPGPEALPDIWSAVEDQIRGVFETAEAVTMVDTLLMRERPEGQVESYWSYSLLPVGSEDGSVGGILAQARETTAAVLQSRRDAFLLELGEKLRPERHPSQILTTALTLVGEQIGANRVGYGEIHPDDGHFTIAECWTDGTVADLSGDYPIGHFNPRGYEYLRTGKVVRIPDREAADMLDPKARKLWRTLDSRASLVVPLVRKDRYSAFIFAHCNAPHEWTDHEEVLLSAVLERLWQDFRHARSEAELRYSEQRFRQIFENANDLIFSADLEQRITGANPAAAAALGLTVEEIVGRSIREFVSDEGWAQTSAMIRRKLDHGGTTRHDIEVRAATGARLFWEINSSLATDRDGRTVGLSAIARDVTERRQYEDRQRLLVNELNHRVKNMLALVQGLAMQSFRDDRDLAEARQSFQQRLAALAAAHDLLTRESWEGATLTELVRDATAHHAPDGRISAEGPDMKLNPRSAVSLVMALHELCTNAFKYGALSTSQGKVDIGWQILADGDMLLLEWRERGGPAVAEPERRGFGFRMIERALATDLGGTVRIDLDEAGLSCRIEAPVARVAAVERT
jgi:PAS domain S-box-containing protein